MIFMSNSNVDRMIDANVIITLLKKTLKILQLFSSITSTEHEGPNTHARDCSHMALIAQLVESIALVTQRSLVRIPFKA